MVLYHDLIRHFVNSLSDENRELALERIIYLF